MITIKNLKTRKRERNKRSGTYPKPRIYFFHSGETIVDNLMNRRSRPSNLYREVLKTIFEQLGMDSKTKVVWSQKAGCRCGCSPGFIVQGDKFDEDIFVDIK